MLVWLLIIQPLAASHTSAVTSPVSITYHQIITPTNVSTKTFVVQAMQSGLLREVYTVNNNSIALEPSRPFKAGELIQVTATSHTVSLSNSISLNLKPTVWHFRAATAQKQGVFVDSTQYLGAGDSYDVALGDLDGDDDLDAFVVNNSGEANKVWVNQGGILGIYSMVHFVNKVALQIMLFLTPTLKGFRIQDSGFRLYNVPNS